MPYGATHGSIDRETNSQKSGSDQKTSIHMGPANSGAVKPNVSMKGVFREPKGKAGTPAKQTPGAY